MAWRYELISGGNGQKTTTTWYIKAKGSLGVAVHEISPASAAQGEGRGGKKPLLLSPPLDDGLSKAGWLHGEDGVFFLSLMDWIRALGYSKQTNDGFLVSEI